MAAVTEPVTTDANLLRPAESEKTLLRFFTAGSVDDGKSTLIGRLLFDTNGAYEDQVEAVRNSKVNRAAHGVDYSLLMDGLRAEREQGITIDVAYRYFATPRRKFIIADTPGHEQYTRNMATGASTSEAAVILLDARKGVLRQSRRHAFIAALMGIRHFAVAVNKMDLVGWSREVFDSIAAEFQTLASRLGHPRMTFIPLSALEGDNVAWRSARMEWYEGPNLLEWLETVEPGHAGEASAFRMPVQMVIRPSAEFRGFAGQIATGRVAVGDAVAVAPSGRASRVSRLVSFDGDLQEAFAPLSVTVCLEDEVDISRGDLLYTTRNAPEVARRLEGTLVWMSDEALETERTYLLQQGANIVPARVTALLDQTDVDTFATAPSQQLKLNEIGRVRLETSRPIPFDVFSTNRSTGRFILVDPLTNATMAAGIIERGEGAARRRAGDRFKPDPLTPAERQARFGHSAATVHLPGRSSAADMLERLLFEHGCHVVRLRGEEGRLAETLIESGVIVILDADTIGGDQNLPEDDEAAARLVMRRLETRGVISSGAVEQGEGI